MMYIKPKLYTVHMYAALNACKTSSMMTPAGPGVVLKQYTYIGTRRRRTQCSTDTGVTGSVLRLLFVPSEQLGKRALRLFLLCNPVIDGGRS